MRMSALLLVAFLPACARGVQPAPPAPAPPPPRPARTPPPISSVTTYNPDVFFCVVRNGRLESVEVQVLSFNGDTVSGTLPISRAFPIDSTYALNAAWYTTSQPIIMLGGVYVKYGLPRILGTTDVVPIATFRGVTVFVESGMDPRRPEVIYLPTRPGCEFQPYTRLGPKE
jgi:hypothetical protein